MRVKVIGTGLLALVVAGCSGAPAVPSPTASPPATLPVASVASPTAIASPTAVASPAAVTTPAPAASPPLSPTGSVAIPGVSGAMASTYDGEAIWVSGNGVAWRVDPDSVEATSVPVPISDGSWTGLLLHHGDLWAADFYAGRIFRIDPETGDVLATFDTPHPTSLVATGKQVWFAHELEHRLSRIDVPANTIDLDVAAGDWVAKAGAWLWYSRDVASGGREAVRADLASGESIATYPLPDATGCSWLFDGSESVWTWCPAHDQTTVAVIDLATSDVSSFVTLRELLGGLFRMGSDVWGVAEADGTMPATLLQLSKDGPTGAIELLPEGVHPDTSMVIGDSLWVPSEGVARLYRFGLERLAEHR